MIREALLHCPQIGPSRLEKLHAAGIRTWSDVIERQDDLPAGIRSTIVAEVKQCLEAIEQEDIAYFVNHLAPRDRWRILSHFLDDVSFFDIETDGLDHDAAITTICCWHRGQVYTFLEHENLDDFLDLLDEITLLSSFNGSTFDVPRVLDAFHIPNLPCPHLDLRWLCYHKNLRGGLKEICFQLGIFRPQDLEFADGELAIRLWMRWLHFKDKMAKSELIRYCASDVILLKILAEKLVGVDPTQSPNYWDQLPSCSHQARRPKESPEHTDAQQAFGQASPTRLRGRQRKNAG